jgi:hypothetical protein
MTLDAACSSGRSMPKRTDCKSIIGLASTPPFRDSCCSPIDRRGQWAAPVARALRDGKVVGYQQYTDTALAQAAVR